MIKGGFQGLDISGVDLTAQSPTLPGGYAACAAADGKPIRVLTAAGAVQCSVKKVSTNYVLAGITGDGKILSITIGSTDGISVSEVEIPDEEADEYLDSFVNINSATSAEPYTAPYDGIVKLLKNTADTLDNPILLTVRVGQTQSGTSNILRIDPAAPAGTYVSCFVKKGTILFCTNIVGSTSASFLPYKPVES